MGTAEKKAATRLGRGIFSLIIGVATAYLTEQPAMIAMAPALNSFGKWLRDKFGLQNIPI